MLGDKKLLCSVISDMCTAFSFCIKKPFAPLVMSDKCVHISGIRLTQFFQLGEA